MIDQRPVELGPVPVPPMVRSLLIFGGTFDPPHRGHLELPRLARDRLGLDWLVYMPAKRSPFKSNAPEASDAQRVEMLQAGLAGAERSSIATIELERDPSQPSYTIDSLRQIQHIVGPDVELRLLIGEDQMRQFHKWKDASEILELAEPAVMLRSDDPSGRAALLESLRGCWSEPQCLQWGARIVELPLIDASASRVRQLLGQGGTADPELEGMVPQSVLAIIDRDGLYGR